MAAKVRGWLVFPTGLFIRDYLIEHHEAYPQQMWRALKSVRKERSIIYGTYQNFRINYIYVLKKLGLIRPVRRERFHPKMIPRTYYSIVPGMEKDPRWAHPQIALDPRRGKPAIRRKYAKAMAKRLAPRPLSSEEIDKIWNAASTFLKEYRYILTRDQLETIKPEWVSEVGLYSTFEERVGYAIKNIVEVEYISRIARRLISPREAPEPLAREARRAGETLEREWLKR